MRLRLQFTNGIGVVVGDFEVVDLGGQAINRLDGDDLKVRTYRGLHLVARLQQTRRRPVPARIELDGVEDAPRSDRFAPFLREA